jgi:sugar lactone lactonase YvrE
VCDKINSRIRAVHLSTNIITTVAGTGKAGYNGDNIDPKTAQLNTPTSLVVDEANNYLYFADQGNYRIRKIDINANIITTFVGSGVYGFSGDGGPAINARIIQPFTLLYDSIDQVLYFADADANRVRAVDCVTGNITIVAGGGMNGLLTNVPATNTTLSGPKGLALDKARGLLFIMQTNGYMVVVDTTGIISNFVGNGQAYSSYGDGGPALEAKFVNPTSLALDTTNNILYVLDSNQIRVITNASTSTSVPTATPTPTFTPTTSPTSITTSTPATQIQCFNVSESNPQVCSGNGACMSTDNCQCNSLMIIGTTCEINMQTSSASFVIFDTNSRQSSINIGAANNLPDSSGPISYSFTSDNQLQLSSSSRDTGRKGICLNPSLLVAGLQTFVAFSFPTALPSGVASEIWLQDTNGDHRISSALEFVGVGQSLELTAGSITSATLLSVNANVTYVLLLSVDSFGSDVSAQIVTLVSHSYFILTNTILYYRKMILYQQYQHQSMMKV